MNLKAIAVRVTLLFGAAAATYAPAGETMTCRIVGVADGDTLTCLTADKNRNASAFAALMRRSESSHTVPALRKACPISLSVKPQRCIGIVATDGAASSARYG